MAATGRVGAPRDTDRASVRVSARPAEAGRGHVDAPHGAAAPRQAGRRRTRRKAARPGEILAAALTLFGERGFAATRLEDVADRAGVSKGTVYLYFAGKEALFEAVVGETLGLEIERAERLVDGHRGSQADLLAGLLAQIIAVAGRKEIGAIPKMVIAEAGNFPDLARFYLDNVIKRVFRLLTKVVERGIERGEFRAVDVASTVQVLLAPLLFVAQWRHAFEDLDDAPLDVAAIARAHVDLVLTGLRDRQGANT